MKIGICGGTFDPFHRGHLDPVLAVRTVMQWSALIYVPAHRQPFKADRLTASGYHRFTMAVLATEALDDVHVTPRELERGDISYTVDTLELLRSEYPDAVLDWIIGDDNLEDLTGWKDIDRIFQLANFAVLTRVGARDRVPDQFHGRVTEPPMRKSNGSIVFAANATVPVSSSEIRRRVRAGESIADMVDPRVSRYIHRNRLYQEALS